MPCLLSLSLSLEERKRKKWELINYSNTHSSYFAMFNVIKGL